MELQYRELDERLRLIKLSGRMDISGVSAIESQFADFSAGENPRLIVDLADVEFLASIGIRLLTVHAKSLASRGGRMVLLNPRPDIKDVLDITGIPAVIPIYKDLESAESALRA